MTRAEMLALLRELAQIEQNEVEIECGDCRRNTDVNFPDELAKCHDPNCKLAAAISWLEDENNSEVHYEYDNKPATRMWVLR